MRILPAIFVAVLIGIDRLTKYLALTVLKTDGPIVIVEGFMGLCYVENRGAAFGILQGARWLFVILTVGVLIGVWCYYRKMPRTKPYGWVRLAMLLVTAGAIGNCIDRAVNGFVIDFLQTLFMDFPVFNMADIYVVTGATMMCVLLLFFIKDEKEPETEKSSAEDLGE